MTLGLALSLANLRYWSSVAPVVRKQLGRWELSARSIPDPFLRAMAREKLRTERFNVEMAATMSTLAKRPHRREVVHAIVALQVMYDYLDLLTEQHLHTLSSGGDCLYEALTDAVRRKPGSSGDYYRHYPRSRDGGYLGELVETVRAALAKLPAADSVEEVMGLTASRCAEAQILCHQATGLASCELERWAKREAKDTTLQWPELLAGSAASVLALHALIAAAADGATTRRDAEDLDATYLLIGAVTMLDSIVDEAHDLAAGELNYVRLYESRELMATRMADVAREAKRRARMLPNAAHHIVTLAGIVAYYCSASGEPDTDMQQISAPIRRELGSLMTPTVAILRAWRLAKSMRAGSRIRIAEPSRPGRFAA